MSVSRGNECGILAIDVLRTPSQNWESVAQAANQAVTVSRSLMEKYMISSSLLGRVDVVATSDLVNLGYFESAIANWLSESGNMDFEFQCSSTLNSLGTLSNALNWGNSTLADEKLSLLISADSGEVVVLLLGGSSSFKFDIQSKTTSVTKTTQQLASLVASFSSKSTNAHFLRKNPDTQLLRLDQLLLEVSGVSGQDELFNYSRIEEEGMLDAAFKQKYLTKVQSTLRPSPTSVWKDLIQLIVDHGENLIGQHVVLCSRTGVRTTLQSILPSTNSTGNAQFSLGHMQSVLRASLYAQQEVFEEVGLRLDSTSNDSVAERSRIPRSDTQVWASGRPNVKVVITGISAALPGRNGDVFTPGVNNIRRIIDGECFISPIPDSVKDSMLEKNVITQSKNKEGKLVNTPVSTYAQGINVSATLGNINLSNYGIAESIAATMDRAVQVSIAAGLEAMRDAGLVTGVGAGTSGWELPESMQSTTGVVYATSFPALDTAIAEVSKFFAAREVSAVSVPRLISELRARLSKNILEGQVLSADTEAALTELEVVASEAALVSGEQKIEPYAFDRKFLFRVLVLGNAQLAQIVKARGPNMQTNAACAGATQAIALAYDMIQVGRAERVVVIAGDSASSDNLMPWLGNGFRILGAATTTSDLSLAAKPFGAERTGMILGSGGIGMVLESEAGARRRHAVAIEELRVANQRGGLDGGEVFTSNSSNSTPGTGTNTTTNSALTTTPSALSPSLTTNSTNRAPFRCRLLGTLLSNSAYHGAAMDKNHIAEEFERFVSGVEAEHGISRQDLAKHGVYFSHETGTHASPSTACAANEIYGLRKVFGTSLSDLLILNTKGFTGHPMGVSFEDVVAVEVLNTGMVPPIANFTQVDPYLGSDLKLSQGGAYPCKYAIRFAAGFGSQIALALYGVA